jgi:hypothetical protein
LLALSLSARIAGAQPEAPQPLRFTSEGTPDTQKLNFENILQGSIRLKLVGYAAGPLTVFDGKATVEQRRQGACTINVQNSEADLSWATPPPGCSDLLAPLAHAQPTKLAIAKPDSSAFALIELSGPAKYAGPTTSINATFDKTKDSFDWTKAIPAYVKQVAPAEDCWVRLDSWQKLTCGAPGISPGNAQAALEAAWRRGDSLELFMQVIDAESTTGTWRRFPFTGQERKQPVPVQAPTSPLESRCQSVARTTHVEGAFYAVCVDAMRAQQSFLVLSCDQVPDANETCDVVGDVLRVRRNLLVYVWHDAETRALISLTGTPGNESLVYTPPAGAGQKAMGVAGVAGVVSIPSVSVFGPRKAGTADLLVKIVKDKEDGSVTEVLSVPRTLTFEAYYRMALRLGIGFTWAPWARTVGIDSTSDGQRYTRVLSGEDGGVYSTEVVAGASYFLCDMPASDAKLCGALGARLGVVGVQGSQTKVANSLMFGVEAAIGKDFSIGLFGGVVRHDVPDDGYRPGRAVPANVQSVPTHFAVTPGMSLVLNFTPGFLQSVGIVQ